MFWFKLFLLPKTRFFFVSLVYLKKKSTSLSYLMQDFIDWLIYSAASNIIINRQCPITLILSHPYWYTADSTLYYTSSFMCQLSNLNGLFSAKDFTCHVNKAIFKLLISQYLPVPQRVKWELKRERPVDRVRISASPHLTPDNISEPAISFSQRPLAAAQRLAPPSGGRQT